MPDSAIDFEPEQDQIDFTPEDATPPPVTMNARRGGSSGILSPVTMGARRGGTQTASIPPPLPPLTWKDYMGAAVGAVTDPAPGAESGIPSLGPEVAQGAKELSTPGQRVTGGLRLASAGAEATTPVMGPALLENPLSLARGFAEGAVASKGTGYVANKLGATPEQQQLAENVSFLLPGIARSVVDPQVNIASSPEATAGTVEAFGGRAKAGVAVTPEAVTLAGGLGSKTGRVSIPRTPKAPAQPAIEPQTIEGQPITRAEAADYMERAGWDPDKARALAEQDRAAQPVSEPAVVTPPAAPKPEAPAKIDFQPEVQSANEQPAGPLAGTGSKEIARADGAGRGLSDNEPNTVTGAGAHSGERQANNRPPSGLSSEGGPDSSGQGRTPQVPAGTMHELGTPGTGIEKETRPTPRPPQDALREGPSVQQAGQSAGLERLPDVRSGENAGISRNQEETQTADRVETSRSVPEVRNAGQTPLRSGVVQQLLPKQPLSSTTPATDSSLDYDFQPEPTAQEPAGATISKESEAQPTPKQEAQAQPVGAKAGTPVAVAERQKLGLPPKPGEVGQMNTRDIRVSPSKFQYKLSTDAEGVGTLLKETKVFNPDLAGVVSVWRDPSDGKTYVINGHHRYELAKRTGQKTMAVRHIVAADAAEARAVGARQNIGEGRGTPVDAAKFFRDTSVTPEDLDKHGISLGEATAAKGLALSKLEPTIFNRVVQGDLSQGRAAAIGEATADHAEQKAILSLVERKERSGAKVSDATLSELIRLVKGSEQTTETTADLFGSQQITRSLALEKAEISAHIKQQLAKDKKLFGFVAKEGRATELARAGNRIDVEKSKEISSGAAQAEEVYNKLSSRGGPISSILDESARRLADGDNAGTVKSEAYQRVRDEVSKTLGNQEGQVSEGLEKGTGRPETPEASSSHPESAITDGALFDKGAALFKTATGPILPSDATGAAFQVRHPGNGLPNYLRLNAPAMSVMHRLLHVRFRGVNLAPENIEALNEQLGDLANSLDNQKQFKAADAIRNLQQAMLREADLHDGLTIVAAQESPEEEARLVREELMHSAVQRRPGKGYISKGVPWQKLLTGDTGFRKMAEDIATHLESAGLAPQADAIVAEAAADLFGGDDPLTPKEASASFTAYLEAVANEHGTAPLEAAQAIYDFIDQDLANRGIIPAGEQFDADITAPARQALTKVLSQRRAAGRGEESAQGGQGLQAQAERGGNEGSPETRLQNADRGPGESQRSAAAPEGTNLSSTQPVGLTDEELETWAESKGFRYEPAGEQLGMFGSNDQVFRVYRIGPKGKEQSGLIYQQQLDNLHKPKEEPTEPFALTSEDAPKEDQPRLFGAGDLGEIIGGRNSLFRSESGSFSPSKLNPFAVKRTYATGVEKFISQKLKIGDKYYTVKQDDPVVAEILHEVDNAPLYYRNKAKANLEKVTKGLTPDQVRLASLLVDSDSRDYLQDHKRDEYNDAINDPEVMAAVKRFKPLQEELTKDREDLGWPIRKSLTVEENEEADPGENRWIAKDRDGNPVADFKSEGQAAEYVDENATVEPHLKRTYPEHMRSPLPADTGGGPFTGTFYADKGLRPPRMDKKARVASAEYHYQHGAKDFSGYPESFAKTKEAVLKQQLFDKFTDKATDWKAGTAQPPTITYNGKKYTRPDIVLKAKQGGTELEPYGIYDPSRGERFLIKTPAFSTLSTGKPGIGPNDRFLAPKRVVDALEKYDATRGGEGAGKLRKFFQEQIVGLFGPVVHVNNILRHAAQATGALGTFDPRSWPTLQKIIFSKAVREQVLKGLDDSTIDMLSRGGSYTDWSDIGNLNAYIGGNLNPANWIRTFGKGVLFNPKFAGGWGGLDPKARTVIADFLKDHVPGITDPEIRSAVEDGFGNYNRKNWTERQRMIAKFTLFPGWDTASFKWFLRHPFLTALVPAAVMLAINLAMNALGKNKDQDKYDFSYLHYGDRKFRSGLITDSMASHIAEPVLAGIQAAIKDEEIGAAVGEGFIRGAGSLAGTLVPEIQLIAEQLFNRKFAGSASEIVSREDKNIPGKVLPNRDLEKRAIFAALKIFPAVGRFLAPDQTLDWKTGVGSALGVTNYKYGAEERLKANTAKAMGYSQTLSTLGEREPEAAEKFVADPNKAVYLMFNGDLTQMEKDLKEISTEREKVLMAGDVPAEDRRDALKSLDEARGELLKSADALNDQLTDAKLQMKKAQ